MVRSKKYLAGSRGQQCSLRIPGYCNYDPDTVVPCHIRDGGKGTGNKASDLSVANGCSGCHRAFDLNLISREDWLFYALRGLQETLEQRVRAGLLVVPQDIETPMLERPIKARRPKEQRTKIAQPDKREWPKRKFGA